jgi:hypothetical protein
MRALFVLGMIFHSLSILASDLIFQTSQSENLRILQGDVLELLVKLPPGTTLSIPGDNIPEIHLYRLSSGQTERSSNGFHSRVQILAIRSEFEKEFTKERIAELNNTINWISVTSLPIRDSGDFPAIFLGTPEADFLQSYEASGKPKFNFSRYFQTRFPERLNLRIEPSTLPEAEFRKWTLIMNELRKAADRSVENSADYLFMPIEKARQASLEYEQKNIVSSTGAWTIAVKATAVRNGFPNVPCAEFMSEMLRQAYQRAGYDLFEDFNLEKGTYLIWSTTAAVINLSNTLVRAGWIPWELAAFKPPTGSIMAHFRATSPGHVYMAAGFDGRLIIDNGAPAGRQLFKTTDKTIKIQYLGGVFFLPPGIIPEAW